MHFDPFWPFMQLFCLYIQQPCALNKVQYSADWERCHHSHLTPSILKKFPTLHWTRRFITTFTSSCHLPLSWASLIQSIMSLFRCLGRTRVSVQGWGFLCKEFITGCVFTMMSWLHLAQPPSRRTTPCRLSTTACSINSQLPSILEAVHLQPEDAPCRGDREPPIMAPNSPVFRKCWPSCLNLHASSASHSQKHVRPFQ